MLSDRNVKEINRQIEREIREANWADTHQEKMDAIERIATLKALLYPQPSQKEILEQLATALQSQPTAPRNPADLVTEIFATFRR